MTSAAFNERFRRYARRFGQFLHRLDEGLSQVAPSPGGNDVLSLP